MYQKVYTYEMMDIVRKRDVKKETNKGQSD